VSSATFRDPPPRLGPGRRLSTFFRAPRVRLGGLLACRSLDAVVYSARSPSCSLASFWQPDPFTSEVVHTYTLDNFRSSSRAASTGRRLADDQDGGAGDDRRRRARVPDRLLHGAGRVAADARTCSSSPS
jgi:hypothetical protein